MPRVPVYSREVGTAPLADAKLTQAQTPDSEGAGLANAKAGADEQLAGVGVAAFGAGEKLGELQIAHKTAAVDQANETAVLDASNKLDAGVNQMLFDPQNGALTLKGKDALGLPEVTQQKFQEMADNLGAGLTNPKQRMAFARVRAQADENLDTTIRRHVFQETQSYEKGELVAFLTNKKNNAVANATDPRRVFQELRAGEGAIQSNAARQGMGPEETTAAIAALRTDTHVGVIDSLLARNLDGAAKAYYEETKDEIDGGAAAKVEKAIAAGALRGQAQQQSDAILAAGGTDTEQSTKVKAITDPELRDAVQERVEHAQAVRDKQTRDAEQQSLNDAYATVDRTHTVDSISPAAWVALGTHQPALREYAQRLTKGEPVETDAVTYYGLLKEAASDPTSFVGNNLLEVRGKLDNADFKQLADMQLRMQQGEKDPDRLGGYRTAERVVDDSLTRFGVDLSAKDSDTKQAIAELRTLVDKNITTFEQSTNKKATPDDVQKITDRILAVPAKTTGSWWALMPWSGVPLSQLSNATRRLADIRSISDVPKAEQDQIRAARDRRGLPSSDADVLQAYVAQLSGVYGRGR